MNIYQTSMENLHIGNKSQQDGPNLESISYLNKTLSSYMKRFQCYSTQKSFLVVVGDIAIIATSSRSRSLRDLR